MLKLKPPYFSSNEDLESKPLQCLFEPFWTTNAPHRNYYVIESLYNALNNSNNLTMDIIDNSNSWLTTIFYILEHYSMLAFLALTSEILRIESSQLNKTP